MKIIPSRVVLSLLSSLLLLTSGLALAGNVTNSGDDGRTGWYPDAGYITPAIVSSPSFGQRWNTTLNGQIYGQPLVAIGRVFYVTQTNWVYSLDADTGAILWSKNLGTPWNSADVGCNNIAPTVGITVTPVIDDDTNVMYLVNKTYDAGIGASYMHALDLISGAEKPGFPVKIQGNAQNSPSQPYDSVHQHARVGLLLMNGVVYAGFGAHCDFGPWQGWVFGIDTSGQIKARWTSRGAVNQNGAAIWMSGNGLVSDGPGRIIFATGNGGGQTVATPGNTPPVNCGECVERLDVQPDGTLIAKDFFSPWNAAGTFAQNGLDLFDLDLSSSGGAVMPQPYFGTTTYPHIMVQAGKEGYLYLLNRDDLGGLKQASATSDKVIQRLGKFAGVWSRPGVWPGDGGYVYLSGNGAQLRGFKYSVDGSNKPVLTQTGVSLATFGYGSGAPVITSDGTRAGSAIVWHSYSQDDSGVNAALRAYDPVPSGTNLILRASFNIGTIAKYHNPTAARGLVFIGTRDAHAIAFGGPPAQLTVQKGVSGMIHLSWSSNLSPYTLRRANDARFRTSPSTLVDHQAQTSFDDPVADDGSSYFYLVN